ncbi:MAG: hypothetical protein ACT4PM_13725 [Gemmatimonadales bacterium]
MTSLTPRIPPELPSDEPEEEEQLDTSPFFEYLKTAQGHEVATRLLTILEDVKKAALSHTSTLAKRETWFHVAVFSVVIGAAVTLAILDKFSTPVGILLGTLVGYIFGKKSG